MPKNDHFYEKSGKSGSARMKKVVRKFVDEKLKKFLRERKMKKILQIAII